MPVLNNIESATQVSLLRLSQMGYPVATIYQCTSIDFARSQMVSQFLELGYDEILWVDSDIVFDPNDVEKIRSHKLPIVCGIYPKRGPERDLNVGLIPDTNLIAFGEIGGLIEVLWCGAGFLYTQRHVYEDIKQILSLPDCMTSNGKKFSPYFLPFTTPNGDRPHAYLCDDRAFCARARLCGHKIYADTTIRLKHVGKYEYSWEDLDGDRQRFASMTYNIKPGHEEEK